MQHAFDMVHDTSGNYGHWNTPAMFNDPRLEVRAAVQAILAAHHRQLRAHVRAGVRRGCPASSARSRRKQLGVMLGSQIMLSRVRSACPPSPSSWRCWRPSPITGFGPDEAEIWAREATAKATGNDQLAEGLMRGIPRAYLDIGIGTRLGHDSLWTHGTLGKKPDNWFSSLGHFVGGAPASMMADWAMAGGKGVDAIGHLARGNMTQAGVGFTEFMQLALPFKLALRQHRLGDHLSGRSQDDEHGRPAAGLPAHHRAGPAGGVGHPVGHVAGGVRQALRDQPSQGTGQRVQEQGVPDVRARELVRRAARHRGARHRQVEGRLAQGHAAHARRFLQGQAALRAQPVGQPGRRRRDRSASARAGCGIASVSSTTRSRICARRNRYPYRSRARRRRRAVPRTSPAALRAGSRCHDDSREAVPRSQARRQIRRK